MVTLADRQYTLDDFNKISAHFSFLSFVRTNTKTTEISNTKSRSSLL